MKEKNGGVQTLEASHSKEDFLSNKFRQISNISK